MVASTVLEQTGVDFPAEVVDGEDLLATVAEPVRWAVLRRLAAGEACVCELRELAPGAHRLAAALRTTDVLGTGELVSS